MFDHLDDPVPYEPSEALRAAVVRAGRSRRRRHRLAVGGASTVAALAVGAVAGAALIDRRLDDLQHVDVAALGDGDGDPRTEPTTLLLVGVDSDAGLATPDPIRPPSGRTDAIVVVRVDPAREVVSVLPLPRDLWVELPGHGRDRLANARERGGPDLLIATLQADLGIEVDRYAETDFAGAVAIGDALGEARLAFDHRSGARRPASPRCRVPDRRRRGPLALGRARHLAEEVDGTWRSDPTSTSGGSSASRPCWARSWPSSWT
ncbi:MAG: LCP family protein [Acidimicrobiales bacterium]